MNVADFHYDLPDELIAQYPPAERSASQYQGYSCSIVWSKRVWWAH